VPAQEVSVSVPRLLAIGFIFACTTAGWFALGTSLVVRSGEHDSRHVKEVELLWGGPHVQVAPSAHVERAGSITEIVSEPAADAAAAPRSVGAPASPSRKSSAPSGPATSRSRQVTRPSVEQVPAPLVSTRASADLTLQHRQRGLLWYDTYGVAFQGAYIFRNPDPAPRTMVVRFEFPKRCSTFDAVAFTVNGQPQSLGGDLAEGATARVEVPAGGEVRLEVGYRSRGLDTWTYAFAHEGVAQVRHAQLVMTTDFDAVDFPPGTMAPSEKTRTAAGWQLRWTFSNLVTAQRIGMDLPNRLNPGPLASRITFFAPVSLLFFLTVMVILGVTRGENLHPVNYFFLSAAFFAFHLLLAYLVDHVSVHVAFALASATSIFLVVSYLRVVAGMRAALLHAGAAQLVFLVLFSYAFFFEGYTGLTITLGAVATLFVLMQMTARIRWDEVFASRLPGREVAR
jgi:hypothetical protein